MEKSEFLPAIVLSLQKHIDFADSRKIDMRYPFPVALTRLISTRSRTCMEAMESNVDFFDLAATTLNAELSNYMKINFSMADRDSIVTHHSYKSNKVYGEDRVPLRLLQSLCVVLSIWNNQNISEIGRAHV